MKKKKYAISGVLCLMLLLIYPLYAAIYTRSGDDYWYYIGGPVGDCPKENDPVRFLIDENACNVFYKCHWGVPVALECPSGLYFNITLEMCDWPDNVKCNADRYRIDYY